MCVGVVTRFSVPPRLPQELNEPVLAELALRQRHSAVDDAGVEASPPAAAAATLVDVASHVHSDTGGHAPGHGGYTPGEMSTLGELQHFATSWFASLAAGTTAADGVFMMDDAASLSTGGGGGGGAGASAGAGVATPSTGVSVAEAVVFVLDETATASAPPDAPGNGAGFVAVCGEAAARGVLRKLGGRAVRVPSPQQQQHDAVMVSVPCHGLLEEVRRTKTLTRWVCLWRWCSVGSTVLCPAVTTSALQGEHLTRCCGHHRRPFQRAAHLVSGGCRQPGRGRGHGSRGRLAAARCPRRRSRAACVV